MQQPITRLKYNQEFSLCETMQRYTLQTDAVLSRKTGCSTSVGGHTCVQTVQPFVLPKHVAASMTVQSVLYITGKQVHNTSKLTVVHLL